MNDETTRAGSFVPGPERPTLKTIAFMTGLGVTTVSRALKDAPEIGEDTRRRVQLVAQQVGYRPNRAGIRLRTGKTNVVSLILDTDQQIMSFVSDIIYGVSEVLADTAYHLIVTPYSRRHDPLAPVRYVVETGSADGIIISRTEPDDSRVRYMLERAFPFATHGRTEMGVVHPCHDFDNQAFAAGAVRKLASLGRRRLALLGPPLGLTYHQHTAAGFGETLSETGCVEIPFGTISIDHSIEQIRQRAAQLMRRDGRPDGFVSSAAAATLALVAGIEDAGLRLGRDVDVVSKQSSDLLPLIRPELHVVNEDFRLAGRELARAVLGSIGGRPPHELQSLSAPGPVLSGDWLISPLAGEMPGRAEGGAVSPASPPASRRQFPDHRRSELPPSGLPPISPARGEISQSPNVADGNATAVDDYHREIATMTMKSPPHPGLTVKIDCLEPLGLSVTEAADALGISRKLMSQIINGKAGISADMAIRLSKAFGGSPDVWVRMQAAYELAKAQQHAGEIDVKRLAPTT